MRKAGGSLNIYGYTSVRKELETGTGIAKVQFLTFGNLAQNHLKGSDYETSPLNLILAMCIVYKVL